MPKILVRDVNSKMYLQPEGGWTCDADKARQFTDSNEAVLSCEGGACGRFEVVIKGEDDRYDTVVFEKKALS